MDLLLIMQGPSYSSYQSSHRNFGVKHKDLRKELHPFLLFDLNTGFHWSWNFIKHISGLATLEVPQFEVTHQTSAARSQYTTTALHCSRNQSLLEQSFVKMHQSWCSCDTKRGFVPWSVRQAVQALLRTFSYPVMSCSDYTNKGNSC